MQHNDYILTLSCPDRTGIVYRVSGLLFELGCNILDSQQFGDDETNRFFLRVHFNLPATVTEASLREQFGALAGAYGMDWQIHDARRKARLLIMVSKQGHCLNDLLFRVQSGQLHAEIAAIVSNHNDYAGLAASYGIPFHHLPVSADTKAEQEKQVLALVDATSPYALTGSVIAQDREAVELATGRLRNAAGNFYINDKPTGAVVGQQPFGGARASGTNDKAGSQLNLYRWLSARTIKETFNPPVDYRYPFLQEE